MGKVDFALQEKAFLHTNETNKVLSDIDNRFLNKQGADGLDKMDIDLDAWLEVFEDDQVKHEICH